eukprot:6794195-Pyramimonas_sp.AAC.1
MRSVCRLIVLRSTGPPVPITARVRTQHPSSACLSYTLLYYVLAAGVLSAHPCRYWHRRTRTTAHEGSSAPGALRGLVAATVLDRAEASRAEP